MADEEQTKSVDFSRIKNRIRRSEVYWKEKIRKAKEKREKRKKRKREDDALGDEVERLKTCFVCSVSTRANLKYRKYRPY